MGHIPKIKPKIKLRKLLTRLLTFLLIAHSAKSSNYAFHPVVPYGTIQFNMILPSMQHTFLNTTNLSAVSCTGANTLTTVALFLYKQKCTDQTKSIAIPPNYYIT